MKLKMKHMLLSSLFYMALVPCMAEENAYIRQTIVQGSGDNVITVHKGEDCLAFSSLKDFQAWMILIKGNDIPRNSNFVYQIQDVRKLGNKQDELDQFMQILAKTWPNVQIRPGG